MNIILKDLAGNEKRGRWLPRGERSQYFLTCTLSEKELSVKKKCLAGAVCAAPTGLGLLARANPGLAAWAN